LFVLRGEKERILSMGREAWEERSKIEERERESKRDDDDDFRSSTVTEVDRNNRLFSRWFVALCASLQSQATI